MENNHTDKDAILAQWLNGDISAEEAKKHLSDDEFLKYQQIIGEVDEWIPDTDTQIFDPQEVLNSKKEGKVIKLVSWKYASVAAAIVLAIFVGQSLWQSLSMIEHQTAFGETKSIDLPDGTSTIILSANSEVSWKKSDWRKGKRRISLKGKAYIEVPEKGSFDVVTQEGTVSVLGTRFVVHQIEQALHAVCYEGRVRATSKDNKTIELSKGESSLFFEGIWNPKKLFNIDYPEWIKDHITFDNAPLKLVIDELASNYGLTIEIGSINLARRFTGSIPKDNLSQSLKIIFPTLGITYRLEDNTLYLSE
ncbi:MAG: FecR domain-containing protein [Reichenbachiella sp.]|uniref:FecR family protein n=1 Tax=Reichenbachiella sp. TaxID=2184521 RepID=UPI003263BE7C